MSYFKRIYQEFFKKDEVLSNLESVIQHLKVGRRVVYPYDIMEGVCCAVALVTYKPISLDLEQIKAYGLYNKDGSFIGSCYAVKEGGRFWGALVGSDCIFSCSEDAYCFKETQEIRLPLKKEKNIEYVLIGRLDENHPRIWARKVVEKNLADNSEKILFSYGDKFSLHEAIHHCEYCDILKD